MTHPETGAVTIIRRVLFVTLALGLAGTGTELLLLKHFDGFWQLVPVSLVACALLLLAWFAATRSGTALRLFRALMLAFIAAGLTGLVQHFRGNLGYARDSNPSLAGRALYAEAVMGATPALAPGTMIQIALIGLAFAFRHPSLGTSPDDDLTT